MRGFLAVAMLLMFLACVSGAQQPPPDDPVRLLRDDGQRRAQWANEWLRSGDPRQVAWGAWLARQDRRTELIPLLLQQVREYQPTQLPPPAALDHHDALLVVLDALIELNATVPVEDARKLYSQFPAQSLILLVRSREDNQSALLEILQNAKANWNWLATGNVLAQKRTPGFAALLLSRFTQHITVTVIDERLGGLLGGLISECAPLHRAPKQGWPPVGLYELTQIPERIPWLTATFLAGGETSVYYLRAELGGYDNPPDEAGACDDGDRDRFRAQYLNKFLEHGSGRVILEPYSHVMIEWKGEAAYTQQLLGAVEEKRRQFSSAVAVLQDYARVLTPDERAKLEPRIEIVIRDERVDRSSPLAAVPESVGAVTVRPAFSKPLL